MSRKLLLSDDSATIHRVIELTFSGEDVQVVSVTDGAQAIARIPVEKPDIVLAGIGTPKRSGYEVAAFVKEHPDLSHVPVLLLAGAFEPVDDARARAVKSDGVLIKPFEPQQVVARVRALLKNGETPPPTAEPPAPASRGGEIAAAVPPIAPRTSSPNSPAPAGTELPARALDEYFDRLDAAFSTLRIGPPPGRLPADRLRPAEPASAPGDTVPTLSELLGAEASGHTPGGVAPTPSGPADSPATLTSAGGSRPPVAAPANPLADVFNRLFAAEQGQIQHIPPESTPPRPEKPETTDDLVEQVTRLVLQRLMDESARDLVSPIVSEIAERLVRQEIDRIKNAKTNG